MTLSEVARAAGLSRPTARRALMTLAQLGYVRNSGRQFELGPRVLELGYAYISSLGLPELARPHLEQLARRLNESCSIAVLDGDDVVYVARVSSKRIMTMAINVGTRFPAYATAMGRVLLAAQDDAWLDDYLERTTLTDLSVRELTRPKNFRAMLLRVREQGHAFNDQELEIGIRSLAMPVHNASGTVIAAMNISTHASRGSQEDMRKELLPQLRQALQDLEADVAGRYRGV